MISYKLLLVDDDQQNLRLMIRFLSHKNDSSIKYDLLTAPNGQVAFNIAAQSYPDLIISDWDMPYLDGIALIQALKQVPRLSKIPVIIVTGVSNTSHDLKEALEAGAVDYIKKPLDAFELNARVASALRLYTALHTIEQQNRKLTQSIRAAKTIQQAMLPFDHKLSEVLGEHFLLYRPRDVVSGDFYWLGDMRSVDGKIVLAAVDCTGHGVPGAFMSMIGNDLLNYIVNERQVTDAHLILEYLHNEVRSALQQASTNNRDGMDIALVVIDPAKQILQFAGAKLPLIYRQQEQIYKISGDRRSIGGRQKEDKRVFTLHEISLSSETNITFYLFSDGFIDQFGGPNNQRYTSRRFFELLQSIGDYPLARQRELLAQTLNSWQGVGEQIDDILVMGVKLPSI